MSQMKNKNNNIHSRMLIGRTGVIPFERILKALDRMSGAF